MIKEVIIILILALLIFSGRTETREVSRMKIENNTIYMDSLTLKQKIAQMFIVKGEERNLALTELNIGE